MKKLLSVLLSCCIMFAMVAFTLGMNTLAAVSLSDAQIAAKKYPLPNNQAVSTLYATFDEASQCTGNLSTENGTYYDTASEKITTTQTNREHNVLTSRFSLDGVGFMFWYKSDYSYTMRVRSTNNNIIIEGSLPSSPQGSWVTYYYFGKCENFSFKTDMSKDIRSKISPTDTYMLSVMTSGGEKSIYFDEFYTFTPKLTPADTYESDEQAFKFSAARALSQSYTVDNYNDDGSVVLSSTYGSTANKNPISIIYAADNNRFAKAIEIAKQGSGYLQFECENISCKNSSGSDEYATIKLSLNGINQSITRYSLGSGTTDLYLWNVSNIQSVSGITQLDVKITGSVAIKDVKFKLSAISVYHFGENELVYQAEDLNPKVSSGDVSYHDHDADKYIYLPSGVGYLSFELPELEIGEYKIYANSKVAKQSTATKYDVCINDLRQLLDVEFSDETYTSTRHIKRVEIGKIRITKDYSYGASTLKFKVVPGFNSINYFDFFVFEKTDTIVEAEPATNFEIKPYPEMDDYELLTVLTTFNDFVCGTDSRWYNNQIAGYIGDGNAYNLNSRCTVNKANFDNNIIYDNKNKTLNGNGIRFWHKGAGGTLQFKNSITTRNYKVKSNTEGAWVTVLYTDIVSDGDLSDVYRIDFKTDNTYASYFDELHTIQEKEGDVVYSLNGDGTASVTGYNLRLENVEILSEYKGCPVVSIADNAFSGSVTLDSVILPDSIKSIGKNAFEGCLNLTTIDFANVEKIDDEAFIGCEKLTDVTLPTAAVNVSNTAFSGCTSLYINVTNGSYAKAYCTANRIDYVCSTADGFKYYCDFNDNKDYISILDYTGNLKALTVPALIDNIDVEVISKNCFEADDLTSVVLPDSVITIEENAFIDCSSLVSVKMLGVQSIVSGAFEECSNLQSVQISDNLQNVGERAFYNCLSLSEFYFGDNITQIGSNAFYKCSLIALLSNNTCKNKSGYSYEYVNKNNFAFYPETDSDYKYYVINYIATICEYKGYDTNISIPKEIDGYEVESVGDSAFKNNTKIASLSFEGNVRTIYDSAFYGCSSLSSVTFNDDLREIQAYSFAYCNSLTTVNINSVVVVDPNAFYGSPTKINYIETNFIRNALDYVDGMTAGWNLGNTLDAHDHKYGYGDLTVYESEHLWRKSNYITQDLFDMVAEKFNTIRIPITWNVFIDPNNGYKIDKEFMDRIQQVVDMCYKAGFKYIIINTHHDSDYYFNPHLDNDIERGKQVIRSVWQQIGERFANYDEKLIFESMNEIRAMALDWSSADWYGQDTVLFERYDMLNKEFYSTVRASGGNNDKRYLMLQTYGGQRDARQINNFWLPSVQEDDHIIASIHWYIETITESHYTANVQRFKSSFVDKGIPCVIGECGLPAYYDSSGNITVYDDDYREQWGAFFFEIMERYSLKAIIWEDHGTYGTVNLSNGEYSWKFPKYIEAIYQQTKKDTLSVSYNVSIDGVNYATLESGTELVLPVSYEDNFVCYTDGENYYDSGDRVKISNDMNFTTISIGSLTMSYGAALRLNDRVGLRYYTNVDTEKIDYLKSLGAELEMGTIIAYSDRLGDNDVTLDTPTTDSNGNLVWTKVLYQSDKYFVDSYGFSGIVGSIVNILDKNANVGFIGRGYVKVKIGEIEKSFYADFSEDNIANNTRSVSYIAYMLRNDVYNYNLNIAFKETIDKYADLYIAN